MGRSGQSKKAKKDKIAAAHFAGYSNFYQQQQQQGGNRPPPPPPPPGPYYQQQQTYPLSYAGAVVANNKTVPPPPPPPPQQSSASSSPWAWATGKNETISSSTSASKTTNSFAPPPPPPSHAEMRVNNTPVKFGLRPPPPPPHVNRKNIASAFQPAARPPPPAPILHIPNPNDGKWPRALHDYVRRAFGKYKSFPEQQELQQVLKAKIDAVLKRNQLWIKDWTNEPLPELKIPNSTAHKPSPQMANPISMPMPDTSASQDNGKWPESLHDFVRRTFENKHEKDRAVLQPVLRQIIAKAVENNELWSKNWWKHPIPSFPVGYIPLTPGLSVEISTPNVTALSMENKNKQIDPKSPKKNKRKKKGIEAAGLNIDQARKHQRHQRFLKDQFNQARPTVTNLQESLNGHVFDDGGELDLEAMTIKGTCKNIEKEYLRLTSAPHPSTVRPENILRLALDLVKKKWKSGKCDYIYVCSQLKSIRQDCTVQHIKNSFTIEVYESHARVALEEGDINEFNQCQTQLIELYEHNGDSQHKIEFLAYRILYCVYTEGSSNNKNSSANLMAMNKVLSNIKGSQRREKSIAHALKVREAVALGNYHRFFVLLNEAPNLGGYIMDAMADKIRLDALRIICKAYRPSISLEYICQELDLKGEGSSEFISGCGLEYVNGKDGIIDTKCSQIVSSISTSNLI